MLAITEAESAVLALSGTHLGLICTVIGLLIVQYRERKAWTQERHDMEEACTKERRQLIDRVVARHTGEVIALDRTERIGPKEPQPERLIEGLS